MKTAHFSGAMILAIVFPITGCSGSRRPDVVVLPPVSESLAPEGLAMSAGGRLAIAEEPIHRSIPMAWERAKGLATFDLCRSEAHEFIGATMRELAEKPISNGDDSVQVFLKDWGSSINMERCKNSHIAYQIDYQNSIRGRDGSGREMVKVILTMSPAQVKDARVSLAKGVYEDALSRQVLGKAKEDFFKLLKRVAEMEPEKFGGQSDVAKGTEDEQDGQ